MPLELKNVTKTYGSLTVLDNFSIRLPERGVVALTGPSGCGKTTLLRLIAGLEKPDSGVIAIPKELRTSMVFQEDRLIPGLTAKGNILAVLPSGKQSEDLADEMLAACGIADAADKLPDQLSGGMQRRVAAIRAVAYGGDILLLDEPFKGLDTATKESIMGFVFANIPPDTITLMVTHDREEVRRVADHSIDLSGPPLRANE